MVAGQDLAKKMKQLHQSQDQEDLAKKMTCVLDLSSHAHALIIATRF